jgi:methionine-gamma-lyase
MEKNGRKKREHYRMCTRLTHGSGDTRRRDFDHHPVPPISSSTAFRLGSVQRGAQGFAEFASLESDLKGHAPVYVYDRLEDLRAAFEQI